MCYPGLKAHRTVTLARRAVGSQKTSAAKFQLFNPGGGSNQILSEAEKYRYLKREEDWHQMPKKTKSEKCEEHGQCRKREKCEKCEKSKSRKVIAKSEKSKSRKVEK